MKSFKCTIRLKNGKDLLSKRMKHLPMAGDVIILTDEDIALLTDSYISYTIINRIIMTKYIKVEYRIFENNLVILVVE